MLVEVALSESTVRLFRTENIENYTVVDSEGKCHALKVDGPSIVVDLDDESMILYEEQLNSYKGKTLTIKEFKGDVEEESESEQALAVDN